MGTSTLISGETGREASSDRRTGVEIPTPVGAPARAEAAVETRGATDRRDVVRAVGAVFLRLRPLVVAPVAIANGVLLAGAGAPAAQRVALGGAFGLALALFTAEAIVYRKRDVREAWLATSLALTLVGLAVGCALSGGIASPLLPLLSAPVVVSFAAFGRSRAGVAMLLGALVAAVTLALLPPPFPRIPVPAALGMTLASFTGATALAFAGVSGLVEAHAETARRVDRLRVAALEEAASRTHVTRQVGAKVAHELKNPLAAIRALVQLLAQGEVDERTKKRLEVALTEVDRMDGIVRDYLAHARPLADLRPEPLCAHALVADVVLVLEARAEAAGVALTASGAPVTIVGDKSRLREALLNLADNAIAATPRGGRVDLSAEPIEDGARVVVEDTGAGMPAGLREGVTTKEGGSGLGLVLARAAVQQHGGTIRWHARDPAGTRVVLELPRAPKEAP